LGTTNYARLRFGIGNEFNRGQQIDYVLGEWNNEEIEQLPERISLCQSAVMTFPLSGINEVMNQFNNK